MKNFGTWEYYTDAQKRREKEKAWLSRYSESSRHISHMDEILMVYRSHRGLLANDSYNFAMHGVFAMTPYMKIEDMKKLKEQIETLIKEKQNDE